MRKPIALLTVQQQSQFFRAVMMVLVTTISLVAPFSVSAQTLTGTSMVTESGDHTVEWTDSWTASLTAEDDFSTMVMLEGQIMLYSVMFIHDEDLGLSEKAVYHSLSGVLVNSFDSPPSVSIEWEDADGSFRGAHLIELSGIDFVLFLRVDPAQPGTGPVMQFAGAPLRAFPSSLLAMQTEITVDGKPVFDVEDGEEVLAHLEGEYGDTQDSAAPEDSAAEAPSSDSASSETSSPLGDRSRLQRDAPIATRQSAGNTYVSATHGFEIKFTDSWIDMASSNSTIGEFSLQSENGRSVISFTGRATTETNRQAFFEDIVARESRYNGYVGSVISDDRLLIATWTADNELAVLEYLFVDDSTVVTIMATITSGNPNRYVAEIQEIEINGEPILRDWQDLWDEDE